MNDDLKIIKKQYGEKMMHLCRDLFSTILDNSPGTLQTILLETLAPSHFVYEDIAEKHEGFDGTYIEQFKMYIYSIYNHLNKTIDTEKTLVPDPKALMRQAGYTLYECLTEEEIQKFKKYYAPGEMLCTFTQGSRLKKCYVYFAVHDNAETLNRRDFSKPHRQDEYGTSVISIQFTRDSSHTLSIKNRYNHTVMNPDATFSNDLDNIIPGLTSSFADYYGMDQRNYHDGIDSFEMFGYVQADDGKLYKYNYEIDNVYYCPDNIIIDNFKVTKYAKEKYIVMDYFILDLVNKKFINLLQDPYQDSFTDTISQIKSIKVLNKKSKKLVIITPEVGEDIVITLDKYNQIISYKNNNLQMISNYFLRFNETLEQITLENVKTIGNNFLNYNNKMTEISLPSLETIGHRFMPINHLNKISFPKLAHVGDYFMIRNCGLLELELPSLKTIGNSFFDGNDTLITIKLPEVTDIKNSFLFNNEKLTEIYLPKVINIGNNFCYWNKSITSINLPNVKIIGYNCFFRNPNLKSVTFPSLESLGYHLAIQSQLDSFYAPELVSFDENFIFHKPKHLIIRKLIK